MPAPGNEEKKSTPISLKEAKEKLYSFCAYQERTQMEARNKLYSYGLKRDDIEAIIADLISEGFISEERFAITYAGGKFRIKKWGRLKIIAGLKLKGVSEYCQKEALKIIHEDDYTETLKLLLEKKAASEKEKNLFKRKDKLARYAVSKGYEPDVVWTLLSEINL